MREAHDSVLRRASIFVDSFATAVHDIGELGIPLATDVIAEADIINDLYGLCNGKKRKRIEGEITIFKNGGGAHLDLAVAKYIKKVFDDSQANCRPQTD